MTMSCFRERRWAATSRVKSAGSSGEGDDGHQVGGGVAVLVGADALEYGDDATGDGCHGGQRVETAVHIAYVLRQVVHPGYGPEPAPAFPEVAGEPERMRSSARVVDSDLPARPGCCDALADFTVVGHGELLPGVKRSARKRRTTQAAASSRPRSRTNPTAPPSGVSLGMAGPAGTGPRRCRAAGSRAGRRG